MTKVQAPAVNRIMMFLCSIILPTRTIHQATMSSTNAITAQAVEMMRNIDIAATLTPAHAADKTVWKL